MKVHVFLSISIFFAGMSSFALQVATYNMQGNAANSLNRFQQLSDFLKNQHITETLSVLMLQESLQFNADSSALQLAEKMGWKSFFSRRTSDIEGVGILVPPEAKVFEAQTLQMQAKDSPSDYSRMAMALQIEDSQVGKVRYVTTHLAHEARMSATRKLQLLELLNWLENLESRSPSNLVILGGDFNTGPNESYYAQEFDLLSQSLFQFKIVPATGANYTWIDKASGAREWVDHLFFSQRSTDTVVENDSARILPQTSEQSMSDHNMVIVTAIAMLKDSPKDSAAAQSKRSGR